MSILRYEENGIEFFTVQATGESGISHSGLAILCGVSKQTITNLVQNLSTKEAPKRLKAFAEKDLHLSTNFRKKGGEVKILRAEFCAAVIKHYALEGRAIAEHSMDKFMTLGMNTWIQSITGWQIETTPTDFKTSATPNQQPVTQNKNIQIEHLKEQLDLLHHNLTVALKHRHAIHNVVEKPTVVDLSLNRIVHTAVHEQAEKLNQALATLQAIRKQVISLELLTWEISESEKIVLTLDQLTKTIEQMRQENKQLKKVIQQQQILLAPRRKAPHQLQVSNSGNLDTLLQPRIQEIITILMQSQKRTGGNRAINTCTKKARIYARYEMGQSLDEIASALNLSYETVKTYVKLTRAEIKDYFSEQN